MSASRVFGIDLGTTYSCIAYIDENGKPAVIPNSDNEMTTPSVVYFESKDNIVVGKEAKNSIRVYPNRVAKLVKRSMGSPGNVIDVDGQGYTPEMVSSFTLRQLARDAEQLLGEKVTDVVITCPAYFGISERTATENAGKLAGLNVRYTLSEPTAAAVYYGLTKSAEDQVVLVYDLGGGTFDVTVIAISKGKIRVVCTTGDHHLGGEDWDQRLCDYLAEQFMAEHPDLGDPRDDPYAAQAIASDAESAKKGLSSKEKSPVLVSFGGGQTRVELTRAKLEELTEDLFDRTIEFTKRVVDEARGLGVAKIDRVLLVGGLSKMPIVARRLQEVLGMEPQMLEPDLAVAKGAALMGQRVQAGEDLKEEIARQTGQSVDEVNLSQTDPKTLDAAAANVVNRPGVASRMSREELIGTATRVVINVCSRAFGVVVWDEASDAELVSHLIQRSAPLPATSSGEYYTVADNQTVVTVRVMEQSGEVQSDQLEHNSEIGRGEISGLPPGLPKGSPIQVRMRLAEDGLLECTALHPDSGRELRMRIVTENAMSAEEVERNRGMLMGMKVQGEIS